MNHPYGVKNVPRVHHVPGVPDGLVSSQWWRPWCECGWVGRDTQDETEAMRVAYQHATGKIAEPLVKPKRTKELQSEVLFDPGPKLKVRESSKRWGK